MYESAVSERLSGPRSGAAFRFGGGSGDCKGGSSWKIGEPPPPVPLCWYCCRWIVEPAVSGVTAGR